MDSLINNSEYKIWLKELKSKIQSSQIKAALSVNKELIELYWELGSSISEKSSAEKRGSKVINILSRDLKNSFPDQKGFSRTNLYNIKKWFEFYIQSGLSNEIVQQLVGQIPWGHNVLIITKSNSTTEAFYYIQETIKNQWSRSHLEHSIVRADYSRGGKAVTNINHTIPENHSALAIETLKDPYKFDFLTVHAEALEKDIEDELVKHITSFLLELGKGFSYVGRQVPLKIDNQEFYIDLLFYHIKLKSYVVVELKSGKFKPEYVGKLNFYISAIDETLKTKEENPSIGLLLCKSKSKIIAEYALKGATQPIGVAEYEIIDSIPSSIKGQLPSIEDLENELSEI